MRKMKNETHIEGYLYSHKLEIKTAGATSKNPGSQFIKGSIDIAVDDAMTNVVSVAYVYVAPTFPAKNGKPERENPTFTTLKQILDGDIMNVTQHGELKAAKLRVDSAIGVNEFYTDGDNGELTLVSAKRNEGGFIHVVSSINENADARHTFDVDMIIGKIRRIDEDPDRNLPEKGIISGYAFNYANKLLPVEFSMVDPGAISYFESLEPSQKNPVFTHIRGLQISENIVRKVVEESAFGAAAVREVKSSHKDFIINWAQPEPYMWDSEDTITAKEFIDALATRETDLAALKQNAIEYRSNNRTTTTSAASPAIGGFKF